MICFEIHSLYIALGGSFFYTLFLIGQFLNLKQAKKTKATWKSYFWRNLDDFIFIFLFGQLLAIAQENFANATLELFFDNSSKAISIYVELQGVISFALGVFGSTIFGEAIGLGNKEIRRRFRNQGK